MPGFFILFFIGCIAIWFLLAFMFKPIGKFFYRIYKDAADEINEKETSSDAADELIKKNNEETKE